MKLSFSTLGCPKLSFRDILSIAKDLGYQGVEIRGVLHVIDAPDIRELSPEKWEATRGQLEKLELSIPILTSACYLHLPDKWEGNFAMAKRYVDTAQRIGTRYVRVLADQFPAPDRPVDDGIVAAYLESIASYAADQDIALLVETNGAYADTRRLRGLLEAVGRANVGVIWDINHPFQFFQESPEETMQNIGSHVKHVHMKDSICAEGRIAYQMLGYGDVPVEKCVRLLRDSGYDGYYSLEWVKRWDTSLEEPGIVFAHYANFMRSL